MTGFHTRWARPEEPADDLERIANIPAPHGGEGICYIEPAGQFAAPRPYSGKQAEV